MEYYFIEKERDEFVLYLQTSKRIKLVKRFKSYRDASLYRKELLKNG